eukprot:jgi/Chrzof1/12185/Cz06g24110.t1
MVYRRALRYHRNRLTAAIPLVGARAHRAHLSPVRSRTAVHQASKKAEGHPGIGSSSPDQSVRSRYSIPHLSTVGPLPTSRGKQYNRMTFAFKSAVALMLLAMMMTGALAGSDARPRRDRQGAANQASISDTAFAVQQAAAGQRSVGSAAAVGNCNSRQANAVARGDQNGFYGCSNFIGRKLLRGN